MDEKKYILFIEDENREWQKVGEIKPCELPVGEETFVVRLTDEDNKIVSETEVSKEIFEKINHLSDIKITNSHSEK